MKFLVFTLLLLFLVKSNKELGLKNILEIESINKNINNIQSSRTVFIISQEIENYYSNEINIYISLIQPSLINHIHIKNETDTDFKSNYYQNYNDLIGPTEKYYNNNNNLSKPVELKYHANNTSQLLNKSEIIVEIIKPSDDIKLYILRNIFFSSFNYFNSCNLDLIDSKDWLEFYDYNYIDSNNITDCHNKYNDELEVINLIIDEDFFTKNIHTILNTKHRINKKINRKRDITNILEKELYSKKEFKMNLKNILTADQIDNIIVSVNKIIQDLVILDNYITNLDDVTFTKIIEKLKDDLK